MQRLASREAATSSTRAVTLRACPSPFPPPSHSHRFILFVKHKDKCSAQRALACAVWFLVPFLPCPCQVRWVWTLNDYTLSPAVFILGQWLDYHHSHCHIPPPQKKKKGWWPELEMQFNMSVPKDALHWPIGTKSACTVGWLESRESVFVSAVCGSSWVVMLPSPGQFSISMVLQCLSIHWCLQHLVTVGVYSGCHSWWWRGTSVVTLPWPLSLTLLVYSVQLLTKLPWLFWSLCHKSDSYLNFRYFFFFSH